MAILKYILPLLSATLLTGCYEDFNPDIDTKPVLCLNSLITAGEPIKVEVTHTWMYNNLRSEYNHSVTDAIVTIIVNENIVDENYLPVEGDHVRIIAESKTYGTATAEVTIPRAVPIEKVKATPAVTDIWIGEKDFFHYEMLADITFNLKVEMDIDDPAGVENFYHFGYCSYSPAIDNDNNEYYSPLLWLGQFEYDAEPIFKEHVSAFETIMGSADYSEFVFFTDRTFSGSTYTLNLNFSNIVYNVKSQQYDESLLDCGLVLYLTSVSKSYYNWAVYKWNINEGVIGDMSDIGLAESKWGYSNVSTGAGVVAAQSSSKFTIDLKKFLETTITDN